MYQITITDYILLFLRHTILRLNLKINQSTTDIFSLELQVTVCLKWLELQPIEKSSSNISSSSAIFGSTKSEAKMFGIFLKNDTLRVVSFPSRMRKWQLLFFFNRHSGIRLYARRRSTLVFPLFISHKDYITTVQVWGWGWGYFIDCTASHFPFYNFNF